MARQPLRAAFAVSGDNVRIARIGLWITGAAYITAGVLHFVVPRTYIAIMPDYLPAHRELVLLSGALEIAGGVGVLIPKTRRPAAWGLVLLLIAVMPANVWMVQHAERYRIPLWVLWLRLPLQVPLILWAWSYTRPESVRSAEPATIEA